MVLTKFKQKEKRNKHTHKKKKKATMKEKEINKWRKGKRFLFCLFNLFVCVWLFVLDKNFLFDW
jgi:hypothetical protein